jgi:pimeloyl-ACP methyl ester carboxylesterase
VADAGCSPKLWTFRRYGPEVVNSLSAGLSGFLEQTGYSRLALFGHSGGGALALLLAPQFAKTYAVVTLAGNLDTAVWSTYHRYSPLLGSLNPAEMRNEGLIEYHYLGASDPIVPPSIFEPLAQRRAGARVAVMADFDHSCCWEKVWPAILVQLDDPGQ